MNAPYFELGNELGKDAKELGARHVLGSFTEVQQDGVELIVGTCMQTVQALNFVRGARYEMLICFKESITNKVLQVFISVESVNYFCEKNALLFK